MAARVRKPRIGDDKDLPPTYKTYTEREYMLRAELGKASSVWGRQFFGYSGGTKDKVGAAETLKRMNRYAAEIKSIVQWRSGFSGGIGLDKNKKK
jgi:hypothetical protein